MSKIYVYARYTKGYVMSEAPVNNKINIKHADKTKLLKADNNLFGQKVNTDLWSPRTKGVKQKAAKETQIQAQIMKAGIEVQKYEEILAQPSGKKIDYNC